MELINQLLKKMSTFYQDGLFLVDQEKNVIGSTGKDIPLSVLEERGNYCSFTASEGHTYYLYYEQKPTKEVEGLLKLLLSEALNNHGITDIQQVIRSLINGSYDILLIQQAEKFHLKQRASYRFMLIEPSIKEEIHHLFYIVKQCFEGQKNIIPILYNEGVLLLIVGNAGKEKLKKIAMSLRDTVNSELYIDARIGIGKSVSNLTMLKEGYLYAQRALSIGKTFYIKNHVYFFEDFHIERMFMHLSIEERKKIYIELFGEELYDSIEEEAYKTIEVFFEKNLHLGDTARALFIHRNTLAYRLDKIYKATGLDLRKFEDAMFFKVGWMLRQSI